jgi:peptidyl-prolyl cis-trans isomerase D
MLQDIGDKLKTQRWLGIVVLGILGVIFALWGAYGVVDLTFGSPSYAVKVNREEIPATVVQQAWQQRQSQLQQQLKDEIPLAQRQLMQQQLLDAYIDATVLRQRAEQRGLRVTNDALMAAYHQERAFQVDGKFDAAAARGLLLQNGMTPATYEKQLRSELQSSQLTQALQATDFLTVTELDRIFALENEQRELRYVLVPGSRFEAAATVDEARIQAWYDAHPDDYLSTESVKLQYAELRLDALAAGVKVDEAALQGWFEKNQSRYSEPEKRHARHVLIQVADGASAEVAAAALKKAQDVLAQARAGKDFAALAKQYSDDSGSKQAGGDLGWARKGAYLQAFDDALFAMQSGQISDVVKTQYGYHIIKLEGIQASAGKTLASARSEIEGDYRRELASDLFGERQEKLQQRLELAGNADLGAIAGEFGLQGGEIASYTKSGAAPLGNSADLNNLLFGANALAVGHIGGPVALGDERVVLVKVLEHHAPGKRPLAEVRNDVVTAIRKEGGAVAARAAAEAAVKQLAGGADFNAVIKTLGLTAAPAAYVGRGDPQLPVQVRDAAFAMPVAAGKSSYKSLAMEEGGAAILAVSAVRPGKSGANPTNDQQQATQYIRRERDAELAAYQQELRQRASIKRNDKVFN